MILDRRPFVWVGNKFFMRGVIALKIQTLRSFK